MLKSNEEFYQIFDLIKLMARGTHVLITDEFETRMISKIYGQKYAIPFYVSRDNSYFALASYVINPNLSHSIVNKIHFL